MTHSSGIYETPKRGKKSQPHQLSDRAGLMLNEPNNSSALVQIYVCVRGRAYVCTMYVFAYKLWRGVAPFVPFCLRTYITSNGPSEHRKHHPYPTTPLQWRSTSRLFHLHGFAWKDTAGATRYSCVPEITLRLTIVILN